MNGDEAREWIGEETSLQLERLKDILGLRLDELKPETDLYHRAGHAIAEANLAARNAEGALRMVRARLDALQHITSDDDTPRIITQAMSMMTYAIESYIQMSKKYRQARDVNTASLIAELACAVAKRENDGR